MAGDESSTRSTCQRLQPDKLTAVALARDAILSEPPPVGPSRQRVQGSNMGIHRDADEIFFKQHERQRPLALALGEAFEITYGHEAGGLSFWLAEPTAPTRERFGLTREILVVYSGHRQTDARVLTAMDEICSSTTYRNRVDQTLALLIHAGDEDQTQGLLAPTQEQDHGDRVIVPLRVSDLLDPGRGDMFVRSAIARALGGTDLFGMSSPVTSERYFFGRHDLVRALISRSLMHNQNSGLFGLRKTGKTSVLFAVMRALADRPVRCEYVDCHNPGLHSQRWWEVLEQIAQRLGARDEGQERYRPGDAGLRFGSGIHRLLESGAEAVVVMLDEIEYVTLGLSGTLGAHWDSDFVPFWQTMRATHQETQGKFTFLVAGVNPASVEKPHFGDVPNPVFQLAVPHYLEPLDVDGVRSMVRTIGRYSGLQFDEPVYRLLQETYGGHPYLIRVACSEVWRQTDTTNPAVRGRVSVETFKRLETVLKARLAGPIRDILLSLVWWYPDEYGLLQILAEGDAQFVSDYLAQNPDSVIQFARYGILRAGSAEFAIGAVRDFLRDQGDTYKRQISPFTRGDMPPELLPDVPDIETLGDLFRKRTEVESLLRKAILLYFGVASGWDPGRMARELTSQLPKRSDRSDPTQLFVGRSPADAMNELYCTDLKALLLGRWELFSPLFDGNRARFEMNIDTLNIARRVDAHTKPVTRQEAADFANSYAWLLLRLERISAGSAG